MVFSQRFFKAVSVCAFLAAVLIVSSWLFGLACGQPATIEDLVALQGNVYFWAAQWMHFVLIFFMLTTIWGVAARKLGDAAGLATTGFVFLLVDFLSTLIFNSARLFVFNMTWLPQLAEAKGTARADTLAKMGTFNEVVPALFALMFVGALTGLFLYGMVTFKGSGWEKVVSILLFVAFLVNLLHSVGYFTSQRWLTEIFAHTIPIVFGLLLIAIGIWLRQPTGTDEAPAATL